MSTGSEANPPDGVSREMERHDSAGDAARASLRRREEHERKVTALRQTLIEGENSGEVGELDLKKVKADARQQLND